MRNIKLVFAFGCLACVGQCRPVTGVVEQVSRNSSAEDTGVLSKVQTNSAGPRQGAFGQRKALAILLQSVHPAQAFAVCGRVSLCRPGCSTQAVLCRHVMNAGDCLVSAYLEQSMDVSRRAACGLGLGLAALCFSRVMPVLPASAKKDVGTMIDWSRELGEAKEELENVKPLMDGQGEKGLNAARISLRKPPIFLIRKNCNRVNYQLEQVKSKALEQKTAEYEKIRDALNALDDALNEKGTWSQQDNAQRPDAIKLTTNLQEVIEIFRQGLPPPDVPVIAKAAVTAAE